MKEASLVQAGILLEEAPSAFRFVQLRRLEPRVISHARIKGKERLLFLRVLCLSALVKPPPHFDVQLLALAPRGLKPPKNRRQRTPSILRRLKLVGAGQAPSAFRSIRVSLAFLVLVVFIPFAVVAADRLGQA
jgi:hypothetical protein